MLALEDQWIWDYWLVRSGGQWHVFFLQAPKSLVDPDLRHFSATVGHATSNDLKHWSHLGTCFAPAPAPAWDDMAIWTGSVVQHEATGLWHFFYTGINHAERGRRQRIGHATSSNLHRWQRVGNGLLLDIEPRWYEEYDDGPWEARAMRDPWVMKNPDGAGWLMFFTARVPGSTELNAGGAIGLARSNDLYRWELQPPVYAGGDFGQLEVPQVFEADQRWYCMFCNAGEHWSERYAAAYRARGFGEPVTGSHYLMAEHPLGPWRVAPGPFVDAHLPCRRYVAKAVQTGGALMLMAFDCWQPDGRFAGTVGDPVPLDIDLANGLLTRRQPG